MEPGRNGVTCGGFVKMNPHASFCSKWSQMSYTNALNIDFEMSHHLLLNTASQLKTHFFLQNNQFCYPIICLQSFWGKSTILKLSSGYKVHVVEKFKLHLLIPNLTSGQLLAPFPLFQTHLSFTLGNFPLPEAQNHATNRTTATARFKVFLFNIKKRCLKYVYM